jgi:hypothetical protein
VSNSKLMTIGSLAVAALVLGIGTTSANAGHYVYYSHGPVYAAPIYAPAPVVYAPPPVVYARPAVVYPAPAVVYPAPVYRSFTVYGGYHSYHHHHRSFSFGFGYHHW